MSNKILYILLVLFSSLLLFACKNKQILVNDLPSHKSTSFLLERLQANEYKFKTISTKATITYFDEKKTSFKATLRIKKDSAIWISITPLFGIEMARALITQDSVFMLDRVHSKYFAGGFDYINKTFDVDLDYGMIEALLIGNSLEFEKEGKVKSSLDRKKQQYYLGTNKKRKVRKELKPDKDKLRKQTQGLWLQPKTYKILEIFLIDPESNQSLRAKFSNYKNLNEQLFPYNLAFELQSKSSTTIDVAYNKVTVNKTIKTPFKIPSKYVQIQ